MRAYTRRAVFSLAAALPIAAQAGYLWAATGGVAGKAVPAAVTAAAPTAQLPLTEQLMYSTTRLEFPVENGVRAGTAFQYSFFHSPTRSLPALVSNAHVFGDSDVCNMTLLSTDSSGLPALGTNLTFSVDNIQKRIIRHPKADLAILPLNPITAALAATGKRPFGVTLDQSLIPTEDQLASLTPVESLLTVGYPGGLWDNVNNLPLFHTGHTATAPYIDFQGRKEFLVDFATMPGASGSPMCLYDDGVWFDKKMHGMRLGGLRMMLLGVVYGVAEQEVDGQVLIVEAPTKLDKTNLVSASEVPTNLGACVKASRILEFEPLMVSMGVKPPDDYVMRVRSIA